MEEFGKLLEGVASLAWPALIAALVYQFRAQARAVIDELVTRIRSGVGLRIGIVEFEKIERVAVSGEPVKTRETGPVTISVDPRRQQQIIRKQEDERYTFLVHSFYPSDKLGQSYDVAIYVVGHFNNLEAVTKVEYFLGVGWGDAVFTCSDRSRNFAIKVSAVGSFLCMATIYFSDGQVVTQSRFVELEPLR
jgi:hypothetical protein